MAFLVDGTRHVDFTGQQVVVLAHLLVFLSECRCLVHDAGSGVCGHLLGTQNSEVASLFSVLELRQQRGIPFADQVFARDFAKHLDLFLRPVHFLQGFVESRFANLVHVPLLREFDVSEFFVDSKGNVSGQRPGGGGPRHEVGFLPVHLEADVDRGVVDFLVVEVGFEVAHDCVDAGGLGHDFDSTLDLAFLLDGFEHSPDRLHELDVHGFVVVVEVNPAAEAAHDLLPVCGVLHHDGAALLVLLVDAHGEHFLAGVDVEQFVDFLLHGQPVAVPTEPALHVVPGLVRLPADHVFDRAGQDVALVRHAGGEGRPILECEFLFTFRLLQLLLKPFNVFPLIHPFYFYFWKIWSF
mmetsp:Transcript_105660/g.227731  ORF Transcript_105660/g.227731 Transcript_105660/m.227731 type:complete len:353 (-) Transcript_105660:81-1139(-)